MKRLRSTSLKCLTFAAFCCAAVAMLIPRVGTDIQTCNCLSGATDRASTELDQCQTSSSCCSSKPAAVCKNVCCCNPEATECNCLDCKCGESQDSAPVVPVVPPVQRNIELVATGLLSGFDAEIDWPSLCELNWSSFERDCNSVQTSQQTCVVLSRFTC